EQLQYSPLGAGGFENKICLVTGAGSGIGAATALAFAKEGATVIAADINKDAAKKTADKIKKLKGKAIFIKTNIAQHSEVKKMVSLAVKRFGRLDCAVNCAGIAGKHTLGVHEYPEDDWVNMININLIGTYYCLKEQVKQMLQNGGGNIVNVSSAAGLIAQPFNSPYAASKFGVVGLTRTAAKEYATQNIRINAVCPTAIETPMIMHGRRKLAENPEALEAAKSYQAMKRMGQPEEVADVILWLCSEQSSFITGHAMPVDGGAFA
ncbi:MAG TPA: SDR family oxidoreductase, partial [Panacibacter sp.]|nr:SDR family oxidoreductase [Panacibacter sp.]